MSHLRWLLVMGGLLLPSAAFACLWDYDTLLQERSRFPDTIELITGKFLRHSPEFYQWRIQDRLQKIQYEPENLGYHDDLAVAYDKSGQHQLAIATMQAILREKPRRYETIANLGTFHIHAGQLEEGLKYIDQALRINPNAHFGREKYQKYLVEYILSCRKNGISGVPLAAPWAPAKGPPNDGFLSFLEKRLEVEKLSQVSRREAIQGILGMMRFGNHESPILLEALANLLHGEHDYRSPEHDAKQLAAMAYLQASYHVSDESAKNGYRQLAGQALHWQAKGLFGQQLQLEELEATFQRQLAEARAWYDTVRKDELSWINEGKDPDQEFARKYYGEPAISTTWAEQIWVWKAPLAGAALALVAVLGLAYKVLQRTRFPKISN